MISFFIGIIVGTMIGVSVMALMVISREEEK